MMHDWADWMGVAAYQLNHWVFFTLAAAIFLYPVGRILGRIGISPFWSLVALVPLVNVVALWALAFVDWPDKGR